MYIFTELMLCLTTFKRTIYNTISVGSNNDFPYKAYSEICSQVAFYRSCSRHTEEEDVAA